MRTHRASAAMRDLAGRRCLVLGAGGFIGTNLCRALASRGARVHGFGRSRPFAEAFAGMGWTAGVLGESDLKPLVADSDVVFHLIGAGLPDSSNRNPAADVTRSILGTIDLLEACRAARPRVVFASSGGTVYGITGSTPVPETAPTEPISAYGIGKLTIEKYLSLYRHLHGLDYIALRIANPYGPYQTAHHQQGVIAAFAARAVANRPVEIWGDGEVVRDFVQIDDVTGAMIAVLDHDGPTRVFNVGSGVGHSVNTIVRDLGRVLHRPVPVTHRPGRPADVPVNVLDVSLIARDIGWRPQTPWIEGLSGVVDWMRQRRDAP